MTNSTPEKIAVIGAGITGVTTAYMLARKGADVTLFEANPYPAMETSYANGGQLSASNAEVWNSTTTVLKGMKWMFKSGAPLLLKPKPSWHKYSWLAEFVAAIPKYRENTIQTVKWALEARAHLRAIAEDEGHHPAILTEWGKVTVTWWSHKIKGLHVNDFIMCAKCDSAHNIT